MLCSLISSGPSQEIIKESTSKLIDAMIKSGASNEDLAFVPAIIAADFLRRKTSHRIIGTVEYDPRKMDAMGYLDAYTKTLEANLFKWKVGMKIGEWQEQGSGRDRRF